MVDRLIKRGNFDDKTEAIEKRCATFQVNIERGITQRTVFAGRHLMEWTTMVRMVNALQKTCIYAACGNLWLLQRRKHSPNPDIPEGVLQMRIKKIKDIPRSCWETYINIGEILAPLLVRLQLIYYCINSKEGITMTVHKITMKKAI